MDSLCATSSTPSRKKNHLTEHHRREIFQALWLRSERGKLKGDFVRGVAAQYSVSERTIRRIWEQGTACIHNRMVVDVSSKLSGRVGRKRVEINFNKVAEVRKSQRTNIRSLSNAIQVSKSTLHRRIKEGALRPHSNPLKPHLSEEIKRARLRFCLSMVEPSTLDTEPIFKSMYDCVHIDEKWFYMTKESEKYYLLPEEEEPYRTCKSKRFITKVMFMAAVARPRFDADGNEEFSGKIGIFPFTYKEPAKRNSKNRAAGTLETKVVTSVTKDVIRSCLIEKVLPAIRSKWPRCGATNTIFNKIMQNHTFKDLMPNFSKLQVKKDLTFAYRFNPPKART